MKNPVNSHISKLASYREKASAKTHQLQIKLALCVLSLCVLTGLAGPVGALEEIGPVVQPIKPLNQDQRPVGWQWHYLDQDGNAGYMEKVAGTESHATYERSDGCRWTRPIRGFAPATDWTNCPSTGKATIEFESGDIWPLKVGKSFSYSIKGRSSLLASVWKTIGTAVAYEQRARRDNYLLQEYVRISQPQE